MSYHSEASFAEFLQKPEFVPWELWNVDLVGQVEAPGGGGWHHHGGEGVGGEAAVADQDRAGRARLAELGVVALRR